MFMFMELKLICVYKIIWKVLGSVRFCCIVLRFVCFVLRNWNKRLNNRVSYFMLLDLSYKYKNYVEWYVMVCYDK